GRSYEEIAFRVMRPFVGGAFTDDDFAELIAKAYSTFTHAARAPIVQLGSNHFLCELFHGPTLAFKDFAMQLIGQLFQFELARRGERVTIVTATSGDTGAAAVEAFQNLDNVDLFVLLPKGRVSPVQQRQMTTPKAENVHALGVHGDFDDCQARLKDMFNDFDFRDGVQLAGVNSINFARVLAQVVYYFSSAVSLGAPHRQIDFTVPTGNFGDIFAGYIAKRMGLSIGKLVIATNQNDILHRTIVSGAHMKAGVQPSISPSMDIQVSSNFERALYYAYGEDPKAIVHEMDALKSQGGFDVSQGALEALREVYGSGRASEAETHASILAEHQASGEVLCPHSAVGVKVANENLSDAPMVTLATAHPAKFPDAVKAAIGTEPALPKRMADLYERPERLTEVPNDLGHIQALIKDRRRT
ncbi:MAG: threonine synthase, partial [Pseudomonadota bacterium]